MEKDNNVIMYNGQKLDNFKGTVIAGNGVFKVSDNILFTSITESDNVPDLENLKEKIEYKINKIDYDNFCKIISFFRKVYDEHKSEAIVLLYYNFDTSKFLVEVPEQTVSGASLDYNEAPRIKGYKLIGSIHSHGDMSAFHSGTDDKDEMDWDGLHITIGTVDENPTYSCRLISNKTAFKVDIKDVVEVPSLPNEFPTEWFDKVKKKEFKELKNPKIDWNDVWASGKKKKKKGKNATLIDRDMEYPNAFDDEYFGVPETFIDRENGKITEVFVKSSRIIKGGNYD